MANIQIPDVGAVSRLLMSKGPIMTPSSPVEMAQARNAERRARRLEERQKKQDEQDAVNRAFDRDMARKREERALAAEQRAQEELGFRRQVAQRAQGEEDRSTAYRQRLAELAPEMQALLGPTTGRTDSMPMAYPTPGAPGGMAGMMGTLSLPERKTSGQRAMDLTQADIMGHQAAAEFGMTPPASMSGGGVGRMLDAAAERDRAKASARRHQDAMKNFQQLREDGKSVMESFSAASKEAGMDPDEMYRFRLTVGSLTPSKADQPLQTQIGQVMGNYNKMYPLSDYDAVTPDKRKAHERNARRYAFTLLSSQFSESQLRAAGLTPSGEPVNEGAAGSAQLPASLSGDPANLFMGR